MLDRFSSLSEDHVQLANDFENEQSSRRRLQDDLKEKGLELEALRHMIDDTAYVLLLIDGDGAPV